jgi:Tfp pilus assembly protein PilX
MEKINAILKNQSGAALVIALVMMVVLTLIGLASIFTSNFEIKISGNKKCSTDAFYAADSGIEVVKANVQNLRATNPNPYNPFTDVANPTPNPTNAQAAITYNAAQQGAPRGFGMSATNFDFQYFMIASTGPGCANPLPASTTTIQEKVVRLIPTLQGGY